MALAARTLPELDETAKGAQELGADTCIIQADVADQSQVEEMVRKTLDKYHTIDILVNNAGIHGPTGPLHENDVAGWIRTVEVNLIGVYLCCRSVIPVMVAQNRGKIVNLSGGVRRNASAYGASKIAVVSLTEILALELESSNV